MNGCTDDDSGRHYWPRLSPPSSPRRPSAGHAINRGPYNDFLDLDVVAAAAAAKQYTSPPPPPPRGPWRLETDVQRLAQAHHHSARHNAPSGGAGCSSSSDPFYRDHHRDGSSRLSASSIASGSPTTSSSPSPSPSRSRSHSPVTPPDSAYTRLDPFLECSSPSQASTSKLFPPSSSSRNNEAGMAHDDSIAGLTSPPPPRAPPVASLLHRSPSIKSSSRNDIFAPSPILTPPRPPPSAATSPRSANRNSPSSRNDLFFGTPSASPSFAVWRGAWQPSQDSQSRDTGSSSGSPAPRRVPLPPPPTTTTEDRPCYGRSSTEDRERERARIRQSKEVQFRLAPTREFQLGEGRHCEVYLGAYRRSHTAVEAVAEASTAAAGTGGGDDDQQQQQQGSDWQLCAVKRLQADRQSQLLGLDEAFALRRLGPHPGIVGLIDICDEVLAPTSPIQTPGEEDKALQLVAATTSVGQGRPMGSLNPQSHASLHGRSVSTSTAEAERSSASAPTKRSGHSRLASQPEAGQHPHIPIPQVRIALPGQEQGDARIVSNLADDFEDDDADLDDIPESAAAMHLQNREAGHTPTQADSHGGKTSSASSAPDPPRLLILLELMPYSLATYSKRHADDVDLAFWSRCAIDLAETLEWMHERGCVHSDIKPENILLDANLRTKLCDFNSAIFPGSSSMPLTDGLGLGTPAYGAPELTKRGQAGALSYPIDIFSLGAVLYSLATGVEPMARARSMIDVLHRKERFFLSEEHDRLSRISVAEGWGGSSSAGGSNYPSRHGSLRRKRSTNSHSHSQRRDSLSGGGSSSVSHHAGETPSLVEAASRATATATATATVTRASSVRSQASTDSLDVRAANVTMVGNKALRGTAIRLLLDPSPVGGVLLPAAAEQRLRSGAHPQGHQRAVSLSKDHAPPASASPREGIPTDGGAGHAAQADMRRTLSHQSVAVAASTSTGARTPHHSRTVSLEVPSPRGHHGEAPSPHPQPHSLSTPTSNSKSGTAADAEADPDADADADAEEPPQPYSDGSPALLLPGGGRLPEGALRLLEEMTRADPRARPSAGEVRRRLKGMGMTREAEAEA